MHDTPGVSPPQGGGDEISLLQLATVLLRRRRTVVGIPLTVTLLAVVISLILPVKYRATASFVPESESQGLQLPGALMGLASQLGVGTTGETNSPEFYVDVAWSRTLRDQVLNSRFPDPRLSTPSDSTPLLDILGVGGDTDTERLEAGREKLQNTMSVNADARTGIVSVSATTRFPTLSADLANRFVELLSRFNQETHQTHGKERRRFMEGRLAQGGEELDEAEEELKIFLEGNRQYEGSPELRFQYERLQRRVRIKEELFTTLSRHYEEARIQEVNDTPVITVIDRAVPPDRKWSPKRRVIVVLTFVLGCMVAVLSALLSEYFRRTKAERVDEFQALSSSWTDLRTGVRSIMPGRSR